MIKKFSWEKWDDSIVDKNDDEYKDSFEKGAGLSILPIPMKMSPQGMILPQGEEVISEDDFDMWILHTNFDITDEIVQLIERIPGVETLEVLTRYRLRVGFPQSENNSSLFSTDKTKESIEEIVLGYFTFGQDELLDIFTPDVATKAREFRDYLLNRHEYWGLYILPNGSMELVLSDDGDNEFERRVQFLIEVRDCVGGIVLLSDDRTL